MGEIAQVRQGQFTADINGLKLWYRVSGEGPLCILPTPGWGPSSELYFLNLTPLEEMFTMVYLDTRGSGRSQRPDLNEYTMCNFVADIEGLRSHIGVDTVWLMGHSAGGPMILNYAFEHRDRVEGLVLVDAPVSDTSQSNERIERMQLRKDESWFDAAFEAFGKMPTSQQEFETHIRAILPFFFSSKENLTKIQDVFDNIRLSFHASQGQGISESISADLSFYLPGLEMPVLIIVGIDDFICTLSAAEFLHREIPHSKLLVIENAGHFPYMEQPDQFFEGIRTFLPKLGYSKD